MMEESQFSQNLTLRHYLPGSWITELINLLLHLCASVGFTTCAFFLTACYRLLLSLSRFLVIFALLFISRQIATLTAATATATSTTGTTATSTTATATGTTGTTGTTAATVA